MADVSVMFSLLAENSTGGALADAAASLTGVGTAAADMAAQVDEAMGAASGAFEAFTMSDADYAKSNAAALRAWVAETKEMAAAESAAYQEAGDRAKAAAAETESSAATAEKSNDGVMGSLKGVAEAMGLFAGFDFLKDSVESAETAQKTYSATAAILASTSDPLNLTAAAVQNLADKYGALAGVQGIVVQGALNQELASGGVTAAVNSGAISTNGLALATVNLAAKLAKGGDTADSMSSAATDLAKALADPFTATRALTAAGDPLTAAQTTQMAAFKAAGDTADAYALVLNSLQDATAGAAAANTTPLQQLQASWADLKDQIGEQLIPIVDQLAQAFMSALPDIRAVLSVLMDGIGFVVSHGDVFGPIAAGILAAVVAVKAITTAMDIYRGVMAAVDLVQALFTGEEVATDAALAVDPVVLLIAAIVGLGVAFYEAYEHSTTFRDGVKDVLSAVGDAVSWLAGIFEGLWNVVESVWNWIVSKIQSAAGLIESAISPILSAINMVSSAASGIGGVISSVGSFLGFAAGGTVGTGGYAIVGENGPELVALPGGSQVIPNGAATRASSSTSVQMASASMVSSPMVSSAAAGGTANVNLTVTGNTTDLFVQVLRKYVRANGGNVQRVLGQ